jgi:nucleotidyltransferase substrate binding protein (TIGR01987 family)
MPAHRVARALENFGRPLARLDYPKEVFRQAYQAGWLAHEAPWIRMLDDRNLVAHTYNEAIAMRICADVRAYGPEFRTVLAFLTKRFGG